MQDAESEGHSVQQNGEGLSDNFQSQMSDWENSETHGTNSNQVGDDDNMDVDHDDGPVRFRSLSEVYEQTTEVELTSDAEIEVNALLAVMEEPTCF
jgi:hypothetical protein